MPADGALRAFSDRELEAWGDYVNATQAARERYAEALTEAQVRHDARAGREDTAHLAARRTIWEQRETDIAAAWSDYLAEVGEHQRRREAAISDPYAQLATP